MLKDRLRQARKNAGKTQKEVAEHLGITESTYCGYETGKREPDALKLRGIASFLNVSGDFLLEIDDADDSCSREVSLLSHDECLVLAAYRSLPDDGKRYIHDQLSYASYHYGEKQDHSDSSKIG